MQTGTVKWFHRSKGYGFIRPADGSKDVFVFYPSIQAEGFKNLSSGQRVQFEVKVGRKGDPIASKVILN